MLKVDSRWDNIESAVIDAPLDIALAEFGKEGYRLISSPETHYLRGKLGKDSEIVIQGHMVSEGVIYFPNGLHRMVRRSPILDDPAEVVRRHQQNLEFYPPQREIDSVSEDSEVLPNIGHPFRWDDPGFFRSKFQTGEPFMNWFLRGTGVLRGTGISNYFDLLERDFETQFFHFYTPFPETITLNGKNGPFVRQVYLHGLKHKHPIKQTCYTLVHRPERVRGIKYLE